MDTRTLFNKRTQLGTAAQPDGKDSGTTLAPAIRTAKNRPRPASHPPGVYGNHFKVGEANVTPLKSERSWMAEIGFPDGTTVRLDGRAEVAWVKQLVESLRLSCSR